MKAMKKRLIPILIILMLVLGSTTSCGQEKAYRNDKYGYSFEVPKTWTVTSSEDTNGETVAFRSPDNQMEITINVSSEATLNDAFGEAKSRGADVEGLTPLEYVIRYNSAELTELGAQGNRIDWNENAVTVFTIINGSDWVSWAKIYYIVDMGYFYIIEFKVVGYSTSELEDYRDQINEICSSFNIEGSTVINLPEGKTVFDF
jgi:hypothetical protein